MTKLEELIARKEQENAQWVEDKKAEREQLNEMADDGIIGITEDPAVYLTYLNLQGDNPGLSAGNLALVINQMPEATQLGSMERWNKLERSVKKGANGIKVLVPEKYQKDGETRIGYKIGRLFDISQTTGKTLPSKLKLREDTKQMDAALLALISQSPVPVQIRQEEGRGAYDPKNQIIFIADGLGDHQTFAALVREIAHARIHNRGEYPGYDREECALDADSVAYMVCRRFGISADQPDAALVPQLYGELDLRDRRDMLSGVQKLAERMGNGVERELNPQEKERLATGREDVER